MKMNKESNKELYSYIVGSINLLNKSIKAQDQKSVQLFAYLYNNHVNLSYQMSYQIDNISYQLKDTSTNQDIQLLSYCIINLDNKIQKISNNINLVNNKINSIDNKIDQIITKINIPNNLDKKDIKKENRFFIWLNNIIKKLYNLLKNYYNKAYKILFKKRIERQLEEQKKKELELELQKKLEQQKLIKKILNNKR